jgi:ABC-type uncharacterized transport system permease subunit
MARRYIIHKRQTSIIFFEGLVTSSLIVGFTWNAFKINIVLSIILFLAIYFGFIALFFVSRTLRYLISTLFSICYGFVVFQLCKKIDLNSEITGVIAGILTYFLSIFLHKDHFDFLSKSKYVEYDRY